MALSSLLHKCKNITQKEHILLFKESFLSAKISLQEECSVMNLAAGMQRPAWWCGGAMRGTGIQALRSGLFCFLQRVLIFHFLCTSLFFSKPSPSALICSSRWRYSSLTLHRECCHLGFKSSCMEQKISGLSVEVLRSKMYTGDLELLRKRES